MSEEIRFLLASYIGVSTSSILMNFHLANRWHRVAKENTKRNLKYKKNLSYEAKKELNSKRVLKLYDLLDSTRISLIPFLNFVYTIENIFCSEIFEEETTNLYNEIIDSTNNIEDVIRKTNVEFLKSIRDELDEIPVDIDDEELMISDKKLKEILSNNNLKYKKKILKYEKDDDIKY